MEPLLISTSEMLHIQDKFVKYSYIQVEGMDNGLSVVCFMESVNEFNFIGEEIWAMLTCPAGKQALCKLMIRGRGKSKFRQYGISNHKKKEFPFNVMTEGEMALLEKVAQEAASRIELKEQHGHDKFELECRDLAFNELKERTWEVFSKTHAISVSEFWETVEVKGNGSCYLFGMSDDYKISYTGVKVDIEIDVLDTHMGNKIQIMSPKHSLACYQDPPRNKSLKSIGLWVKAIAAMDFAPLAIKSS